MSENEKDRPVALGHSPLDDKLAREFFEEKGGDGGGRPKKADRRTATAAATGEKAGGGYKVISISLYDEDVELLEALAAELRRRGFKKVSKSRVIRFALHTVNIDDVPWGW